MDGKEKDSITVMIFPVSPLKTLCACVLLAVLAFVGFRNYLLFHCLVEVSCILTACMAFIIAINTAKYSADQSVFVIILGICYGIIGVFDLLHMLSFKGMNVFFVGGSANLSTELWIAARYLQAIALLVSILVLNRRIKESFLLIPFAALALLFFASIFVFDCFPDCYIDGYGLTDFKKVSEFVISAILFLCLFFLIKKRNANQKVTFGFLALSVALTIASEFLFMSYTDITGTLCILGHLFKAVSFYYIYKAVVQTGLIYPFIELDHSKSNYRELKIAEEKIHESEALLRTIIDSAADFLFLKNRESRVVMVNQAYGKVFGVEIQDVIGKNDYELYNDAKIAEEAIRNDQAVMQSGEPLIVEESACTTEGMQTYLISKVPWRDAAGNTCGVLGIAHNITKLKRAEADLQQMVDSLKHSQEYISILYETTGKLLSSRTPREDICELCGKVMRFLGCDVFFNYLLNEDETMLYLNACEGVSQKQKEECRELALGAAVCGYAVMECKRVIAQDIQASDDPRTELVKSMGIRAYACHPFLADGKAIGSLSFGTRSKDSFQAEEILLMKTVAESISVAINREKNEGTLRKQAEELRLADLNKNEFICILSHELRNPLATIEACLMLLDMTKDREQETKAKEILKRQTKQLSQLVNDLLEITRITRKTIELKKETINIADVVRFVMDDYQSLFKEKEIMLRDEFDESTIPIHADPVRIKQIIGNLMHNAYKFTDPGGEVVLSIRRVVDCVSITVKDTGRGILPQLIPTLFDPFTQADHSIDRQNGGLGLGLSIVKGIVQLHGGTVKAYSEGHMKGAQFEIALPIVV